jgi:hypothetical protein
MNRTLVIKSHLTCIKEEIETVDLLRVRHVEQMNRMVVIIIRYRPDFRFGYGLERYTHNKTTIGEHNSSERTSFMMVSWNVWRNGNLCLEVRDLDEWHIVDENSRVIRSLTTFEVDASVET